MLVVPAIEGLVGDGAIGVTGVAEHQLQALGDAASSGRPTLDPLSQGIREPGADVDLSEPVGQVHAAGGNLGSQRRHRLGGTRLDLVDGGPGKAIWLGGFVERRHQLVASGGSEARHAEDLRDVRLVPAVVLLFRYDLRVAAEDDVDSGRQRTSCTHLMV